MLLFVEDLRDSILWGFYFNVVPSVFVIPLPVVWTKLAFELLISLQLKSWGLYLQLHTIRSCRN